MAEPLVAVQCVCGRMKQRGFICDVCFSTEDNGTDSDIEEGDEFDGPTPI